MRKEERHDASQSQILCTMLDFTFPFCTCINDLNIPAPKYKYSKGELLCYSSLKIERIL